MTGYESKKKALQDKLEQAKEILLQHPQKDIEWQREQQIKAHAKLDEDGMYLVHQTAQPAQEPVAVQKSGIANSPSDPEICNERSAQACGPVYCGDSGGYCNKCPKQKTIQTVKACKGMNCGCTDGRSHSFECQAELAAAIAGGMFVPSLKPPQRTWVGLTDEEVWECYSGQGSVFYRAIEAKLKEKNNG
jgi:hypothetical protein